MCRSDRARLTQALNCPFEVRRWQDQALYRSRSASASARASSKRERQRGCLAALAGDVTQNVASCCGRQRQVEPGRGGGQSGRLRRELQQGAAHHAVQPAVAEHDAVAR